MNCKICEIRPEWEKLNRRYGLHKWIHQKLKYFERLSLEFKNGLVSLEFKNGLESEEEIEEEQVVCKDLCKPSYSDVCANQAKPSQAKPNQTKP